MYVVVLYIYLVLYQRAQLSYRKRDRSYLFALGCDDALQQVHNDSGHIEIRSVPGAVQFHSSSKQFRPDALTIGTQPKTQIIELTGCLALGE